MELQLCVRMQSVPQWLWSPVLEGVTSAVTKASSLQEAVAKLAELPDAFNSVLLPQARAQSSANCCKISSLRRLCLQATCIQIFGGSC